MASIHLNKVAVSFPIYDASSRSLKKRLIRTGTGGRIQSQPGSGKVSVVKALDDVSLSFRDGDYVGLIGHNGSGKTTLLRVLAGIYEPSAGTVEIQGHAVPLFDVALGMDQESTGYENIVMRGLFLGLTHQQIKQRVDDIVEFTELGDFLNLPIRTYSAGMRMRLAFAVSTSIVPDILLLDEGIGAGDAAFLEKANKRLDAFTGKAAIIVLASHSEPLVRKICRTCVLMEHGKVLRVGETDAILEYYKDRSGGA
ncbi:ABC transporter ATP-binding protein [Candidatus Thiosymbion oneisti]|uniref:ABC transporter ATP-binding protein n=1 Tax=Candidatus Thiosymbion oneisti TaxID=589554 RepID=UPI000ABB990A|nr:ABC transporter ATP-binding protein [Candidatus Thiosymbion oneisti]